MGHWPTSIAGHVGHVAWTASVASVLLVGLHLSLGVTTQPIYSVRQLSDRAISATGIKIGSRIRVHGVAWPCMDAAQIPSMPCMDRSPQPVLVDATTGTSVLLAFGPADRLYAIVRDMPFVGAMVPGQHVVWGRPATYDVQVQRAPASICAMPPCYEMQLLHSEAGGS